MYSVLGGVSLPRKLSLLECISVSLSFLLCFSALCFCPSPTHSLTRRTVDKEVTRKSKGKGSVGPDRNEWGGVREGAAAGDLRNTR